MNLEIIITKHNKNLTHISENIAESPTIANLLDALKRAKVKSNDFLTGLVNSNKPAVAAPIDVKRKERVEDSDEQLENEDCEMVAAATEADDECPSTPKKCKTK